MKLSEKGRQKLAKKRKALESGLIEFQPDDFEDVVVLSIKEAKASYNALEGLCANIEERERDTDTSYELVDGWNQMDFLESKLEQSEKER